VGQSGVTPGDSGSSTSYEYDNLGRRAKETEADPDGSGPLVRPVTVVSYDLDGNLRAVTDPRGFTTTYDYDSLGRKVTETSPDPDGSGPLGPLVKRFVYDAAGNLRFEIAPGGTSQADVSFTTEHIYDALNRRIRTILPDPDGPTGPLARPVTSQSFDSSGRLSTTTDALGRVTTTLYRSNDRVMRITAPDGSFMNRIYDAVGNVVYTTEALSIESHGRRTFTSYDAMNRPVSIRRPRADASSSAPITTFRYDITGNQISTTDPLGRTTWQQFDALGRLIGRTDALGTAAGDPLHTTRTEYDSAGRVTATIDELGRRTDTVYDGLGRTIRTLAPDAGLGRPTTHYGYDAAGNLKFTTDPRGAAAGDAGFTTWFFYDALGRQTATVDALGPDWTVTGTPESLPGTVTTNVTRTAYDALGRIASTTDALGQTTDHAYDNLGRKVSETAPAPAAESARPVTRYGYDAVGNKTSVADPLGNVTTYAYDARDRRTTVTDARVFATVTTFDRVGNTTSVTDASGNVTRYAFDRLNRLITETDPLGAVTTSAYDLAGNKTKETDRLGRVSTFVYDAADRLVEERWQASASAAVFHTIKRFYDGSDQLLGVTETDTTNPAATTAWQFSYDALGRVVKSRMAPGVIVQAPVPNAFPNPSGGRAVGDNIPRSRYPATTPACFVWHVDAQ
jgi:YD repeat-containing protein